MSWLCTVPCKASAPAGEVELIGLLLQIRPGAIELHGEELALVVHYEVGSCILCYVSGAVASHQSTT